MFGSFERMSLKQGIGSGEYMKRRIPRNAKYQHVKSRLDTGCSLTKYMERLEDIKKNYRFRPDEIFKRLKVTTFAQLILQVASVSDLNECENDDDSHCPDDALSEMSDASLECLSEHSDRSPRASPLSDPRDAGDVREICPTARSTLLGIVSGVGELSLDAKSQKTESDLDGRYPDCPYLLLDVRDRDQYNCCHIISAHSFPIALLSRTMNPFTKEVLEYKNAAGKIIIVYDEDERIASQAAATMCQRGVENLFMLSGGLKVVAQKFPEGLTTGSIPTTCLSPPTSARWRKGSVQQQQQQQQQQQAAETRWRFTPDELTKIQEQLEEILIPSNKSCVSSRTSTLSSNSSTPGGGASRTGSSAYGRNSGRTHSSRPWK